MIERLEVGRVPVDPDLILRLQKYRRPEAVPPALRAVARRMAALADSLVEPEGWLRREAVESVDPAGSVRLGSGVEFRSRTLARRLEGAVEAALVLLTIGPALERRAEALIGEEQYVEGLLLDTAGWVAMDQLVREVRQRLREEGRARGLQVTARMAPGFADWALDQQRLLFQALGEERLPVELTESCVMLPKKSVTGLFGAIPVGVR